MKRKDLDSGDIYEIPLTKDFGFAYLKVIIYTTYENGMPLRWASVRPINYLSKARFKGASEFFADKDCFYFPILLLGVPNVRGKESWKFIGMLPVSGQELTIPEFKSTLQLGLMGRVPSNELIWYHVKNLDFAGGAKADYSEVAELPIYHHINFLIVNYLLSFIWIEKDGKDLRDFFTQEDFKSNQLLVVAYQRYLLGGR